MKHQYPFFPGAYRPKWIEFFCIGGDPAPIEDVFSSHNAWRKFESKIERARALCCEFDTCVASATEDIHVGTSHERRDVSSRMHLFPPTGRKKVSSGLRARRRRVQENRELRAEGLEPPKSKRQLIWEHQLQQRAATEPTSREPNPVPMAEEELDRHLVERIRHQIERDKVDDPVVTDSAPTVPSVVVSEIRSYHDVVDRVVVPLGVLPRLKANVLRLCQDLKCDTILQDGPIGSSAKI